MTYNVSSGTLSLYTTTTVLQDADSDIKSHQKQVDALRNVARILREELISGLSSLYTL